MTFFPVGAALALALIGGFHAAVAQPVSPESITNHLVLAEQHWQQHDYIAALQAYEAVLAHVPQQPDALQGRWRVWSILGLADRAGAQAASLLNDPATLQRLHEDQAAYSIRLSEQEYFSTPQQRYAAADRALQRVHENVQRYPNSVRTQWDWIRVLANRERNTEAIQAYEVLLARSDAIFSEIPSYVHAAAGQAYAAVKRPDWARYAFDYALQKDPDSLEAQVGRFYALSDLGQYDAANRWIQEVAARPRAPEESWNLLTTAIDGIAYAGDLNTAQDLYQYLQQRTPNSVPLHIALGRIYAWRGWNTRAQHELQAAERRSPQDVRAQNALVEMELNLGDLAAANQRLARLEVIAPDDPDVKNLQRARDREGMHSISVSVRGTRTKDSAGSSSGSVLDAQWMAPPIGLTTRPFVRSYWEQAKVDAIHTEYQRLGVGLEHRIPRIASLRAELQQELYQKKESSFILGGNWMLNDFWQLDAQWDSNTVDVPLRARVEDVSGWKGQVGVRYRAHEGASTRINYAEQGQSDTNRRRTVALDGSYLLLQRPGVKGVLGLEWAASDNSLRNTPYFNPRSDHTVQFSWNTEWLQPMPLDRVFKQQLIVAAGWYAQEGFDTGTIGSISYQHDWRLSDVADLRYGIAYIRRLFDGQVSQGPEANLNFNWRF